MVLEQIIERRGCLAHPALRRGTLIVAEEHVVNAPVGFAGDIALEDYAQNIPRCCCRERIVDPVRKGRVAEVVELSQHPGSSLEELRVRWEEATYGVSQPEALSTIPYRLHVLHEPALHLDHRRVIETMSAERFYTVS